MNCKDCPNKKVGCHSGCAHYVAQSIINDVLREKWHREQQMIASENRRIAESVQKFNKKRKR